MSASHSSHLMVPSPADNLAALPNVHTLSSPSSDIGHNLQDRRARQRREGDKTRPGGVLLFLGIKMKCCCVFRGEFNTLASCPKTNYIGTNFLDAREFSEGSQETSSGEERTLAKKCWGKVDKYLSPDSGNTMLTAEEGLWCQRVTRVSSMDSCLSIVRSQTSVNLQRWGDAWTGCWVTCVTLGSGVCWPSAVSTNKTKRFVGNTCDAAVFNIRTKEFLIRSVLWTFFQTKSFEVETRFL